MYYIKKIPGQTQEQPVHIHVKNNRRVVLRDCVGWIREVTLSLPKTEQMFNAKFRMVTNDDKTKTKVFL